jgi:parallel beta-helix repeat protein
LTATRPRIRASIVAVLVVLGTLGAFALIAPGTARAATPCSVTVFTENLANNAIQTAINAFPGGKICVGPGTFPEQLTISSAGTTLKGAGAAHTIIEPSSPLMINTFDYDSASAPHNFASLQPLASIILVENTTGVTVESLQVNGIAGSSTFTGCGQQYVGVDFQNSSGTLTGASVTNIALPSGLFGCQDGLAVYAYNGWFFSGATPSPAVAVVVSHSTVSGYDKNGITCDDPGETCTVLSNSIAGVGPTPLIAQNGVQIAYGALASVLSNLVTGNSYTGSTSTNDWYAFGYASTGILLYDSGSGTTISKNTVTLNQLGIAYVDDGNPGNGDQGPGSTIISQNTIKESNAYGIVASGVTGDLVTISSNTVNDTKSLNPSIWGAPGILLDNGNFTLANNHISGSSTASGASNGPSQTVCAPSLYPIVCSPAQSITTAAIQGVSESATGLTNLLLEDNSYKGGDSVHLATLGVNGGSVPVQVIS